MLQIFNCGIGYVIIVAKENEEEVVRRIQALHLQAWAIGSIEHCKEGEERVEVRFPDRRKTDGSRDASL